MDDTTHSRILWRFCFLNFSFLGFSITLLHSFTSRPSISASLQLYLVDNQLLSGYSFVDMTMKNCVINNWKRKIKRTISKTPNNGVRNGFHLDCLSCCLKIFNQLFVKKITLFKMR